MSRWQSFPTKSLHSSDFFKAFGVWAGFPTAEVIITFHHVVKQLGYRQGSPLPHQSVSSHHVVGATMCKSMFCLCVCVIVLAIGAVRGAEVGLECDALAS